MKKRIISMLLALSMLISMAPGVFASGTSFGDVPSGAWYYNAVMWAVENEITGGIGNGNFGPDQTCTRAQVVQFLWASAGKPEPLPADPAGGKSTGNDTVLAAADGNGPKAAVTVIYSLKEGSALGAVGGGIGGVFNIAALIHTAVIAKQGSANLVAGIGNIGVVHGVFCQRAKLFGCHNILSLKW